MFASRGMYAGDSVLSRAADAARITDDIASELFCAETFTSRTATGVKFTVADRDGDLNPETISYLWSGVVGDPLTRAYNAQTAVNVLDDVATFELTYTYRTVTEQGSPAVSESGDMLLIGHEPTQNLQGFDLTGTNRVGQYFQPALAPDVVSWRVTSIRFRMKSLLLIGGATRVDLRKPAGGPVPSNTVLWTDLVPESLLGILFGWHSVTVTGVSGLSPDSGLCLVLYPDFESGGGSTGTVEYESSGATVPGGAFLSSADGGSSWAADDSKAMAFRVYGRVTTLGDPPAVNRDYLTAVGIRVGVGSEAGRYAQTSVQVLNGPEVSGP
jgi:hypothetical protein